MTEIGNNVFFLYVDNKTVLKVDTNLQSGGQG